MNKIETILQKQQEGVSERFAAYNANSKLLNKITEALEPFSLNVDFPDSLDFNFAGNSQLLTRIFRVLRTEGWSTHFTRPDANDTSWSGFFEHEGCSVRIWINFTSTACKKVQVGTKLVEMPVYEVRCEEVSPPPESDLPF